MSKIRGIIGTGAVLALAGLLSSFAAHADSSVNEAKVARCFSDAPLSEERCLRLIIQPCSHLAEGGLLRGCLYRLRLRWQSEMHENETWLRERRPAPDPVCIVSLEDLLGSSPDKFHVVRNGCRLFEVVARYFKIAGPRQSAFEADVESLESCLLETSVTQDTPTCAGVISNAEAREDTARERAAWRAIIEQSDGRPPYPATLDALTAQASRAFLRAELQ